MRHSDRCLLKVKYPLDNLLFCFRLGQVLYEEGAARTTIPHLKLCADARGN